MFYKYFQFICVILFNLTNLNEGFTKIETLGANFLIKAELKYEDGQFNGDAKKWFIEESIFGDENSIVTLITDGDGSQMKVFRDFKTQNISLICIHNQCGLNEYLLDSNLKGSSSVITETVRSALLLGPYRIILCLSRYDTSNSYVNYWGGQTRHFSSTVACGNLHLTPFETDYQRVKYTIIRGKNNRALYDARFFNINLRLAIQQTEVFRKVNASIPRIYYKFNESIAKVDKSAGKKIYYKFTSIEMINKKFYQELLYDRKFERKYILSGSNNCTVEPSSLHDEFNYMASENYSNEFVNKVYFPLNPVKSYSNKLIVKTEYDVTIGKIKYDLAIRTYSIPNHRLIFLANGKRFEDFCVQTDLYNKSVINEISSKFELVVVQIKCLDETKDYLKENELRHVINAYWPCFRDRKDKIVLDLEISLLNHSMTSKIQNVQSNVDFIRDNIRCLLIDKLNLSLLRVNLVKVNFLNFHIMAKVEIFDSTVYHFELKKGTAHKFGIKQMASGQIHVSAIDHCLHLQASKANLGFVIACKTEHYLCLGFADGVALPDESEDGLDCLLFNNSDHSLTKLLAEVPLQEIRKSYFNLNGSQFTYSDINFAIVNVEIEDDLHIHPEKSKSHSIFTFFFLFSILINICFFIGLSWYFKLFQHPTYQYFVQFRSQFSI